MEQRSSHHHVIMGIWVLVFAVETWFCCCFGCLDQERIALLHLKNSFNGSTSYHLTDPLSSWKAGTDCCNWERVNCSHVTGRVIELSLDEVSWIEEGWYLNASLLLPFKELKKLDISSNRLRGFTDSEAFERGSKLIELEDLDLSFNWLNETIQPFICALKSLKHLRIGDNMIKFQGSVPMAACERWSKVTELEDLDLSYNELNETILPFVCALKFLKYLRIGGNEFRGSQLMAELSSCLRELEGLGLDGYGFYSNHTVSIPSSIESMTSLKALSLKGSGLNDSHSIQGLCKLKNLRELDLSDNEFQGEIPFYLSNLTNLRVLDLAGNQFCGHIPTSIISSLTSLEVLSLAQNHFSGVFNLSSFAHLSNLKGIKLVGNDYLEVQTENPLWVPTFQLEFLDLSNCNINKLSGVIPSFLLTQQNLTHLDLSHNNLKGNVPAWLLENNTRLEYLSLRNNSFTGTFHLSYHVNDTKLLTLDISNNHVSGILPTNMGSLLPNLALLNMSGNDLQGSIPPSIGDMRRLTYLDLSHNDISGEIPEHLLASCVHLSVLTLSNNSLYGQIFPACSNLTNLQFLSLGGNNFTGSFSPCLFNSSSLLTLDVGDNHMSGELPSQIGDLSYLSGLILRGNYFEGPIPSEFCKLKELQFLDLSKNNLNGSIPPCLNTSLLNYIHLEKNFFSGHIPSALLENSSLVTLDVRNNKIDGVIPTVIGNLLDLRVLLLSGNYLHGTIPFELCQLKNLSMLDLSHNNLSGSIPSCISNLAFGSLASLSQGNIFQDPVMSVRVSDYSYGDFLKFFLGSPNEFSWNGHQQEVEFVTKSRENSYNGHILNYVSGIDLSYNQLTGEIPIEMGHLSALYSLNLSYNQFTGRIPATFSNLRKIECLDLSYNRLNGTIPAQLIVLYFLSSFTVAHNNLSGTTPNMVSQFATFSESSYEGNLLLCGPPLKINCTSITPTNTIQGHEDNDDNDNHTVSFYASFLGSYCVFLFGTIVVLYYTSQKGAVCFLRSVDSWCALHLYKIHKLFYRR